MEIEIPFTDTKLSGNHRFLDLKYRAILSRDSLFYALIDSNDSLLCKDSISVHDIKKHPKKKKQFIFGESTIAFNNPIFSFISSMDYDEKTSVNYLSFCHQLTDINKYAIYQNFIEEEDMWIVYAIPRPMKKAIDRRLSENVQFVHYQEVFLKNALLDNHIQSISISLFGKNMNIALYQSDKLIISNNYSVYNQSEFYYFVSLIFDQYNLSKGVTRIILDGSFDFVQIEKNRFYQLFGCFPLYRNSLGEINESLETSTKHIPLIHVNRCASLQEH